LWFIGGVGRVEAQEDQRLSGPLERLPDTMQLNFTMVSVRGTGVLVRGQAAEDA